VELAMHVPQPFVGNVSVNLGAGNAAVAQKFLDGSNVNALIQQIRSIRMAKGVRSSKNRDTRQDSVFFDDSFNGTGREPAFRIMSRNEMDKQGLFFVVARGQIIL